MSIMICNERFLSRFGVDRILMLLARHLQFDHGVDVSFACLRYDEAVLTQISNNLVVVRPPEGLDIGQTDRFAAEEVIRAWDRDGAPDVVVTGGWPFFGLAAKAATCGVRSIFIDAGAVPHDGFPEGPRQSQLELRRLRRATLPSIGHVIAISEFIRQSQSIFDRGRDDVETVLLGTDHLDACRFDPMTASSYESELVATLRRRSEQGTHFLIALGRYESFGYKNSNEIFALARMLNKAALNIGVLILTGPDDVEIPSDLADQFIAIRTISDEALQEIMRICVAGVSLTFWEGFNLPFAEMLRLGKPVLAYLIGAHPEVTAHPWMLCATRVEMEQKLVAVMRGEAPRGVVDEKVFEAYRRRLTWSSTLEKWWNAIAREPMSSGDAARRLVLIDVSNSARDPANSGVIRVTRRLAAELVQHSRLDIVFVKWDDGSARYRRLETANIPFLASNAGPHDLLVQAQFREYKNDAIDIILNAADPLCAERPVLFLPEVILDGSAAQRVAWARDRQLAVAAICYDMLPIYHAQYVSEAVREAFPSYVKAVTQADAIWAISGFSLQETERYCRENQLTLEGSNSVIWLPGQFSDVAREGDVALPVEVVAAESRINLLCVSTIEPRKNHRILVEAFHQLLNRRPDLPIYLRLVGNSYAGSGGLSDWIAHVVDGDPHIEWHGIMTDHDLAACYRSSRFTVYPSLAEGFGLPIVESLWMGVPCLCHEAGVMAELAEEGGCLTVDMTDSKALSMGMEALATEPDLYAALKRQASARHLQTWSDYGRQIADHLLTVGTSA